MKKIGNYYMNDIEFASGAFSKIYIGYNKYTKKKVAIKEIIIKNTKSKKYIKREIELHKKLNHINIIKLFDIYNYNNRFYMILEFCKDGDLANFQKRRKMNEIYIQNFIFQLTEGLKYLRKLKIAHRDLKPHNLLIDNNVLKISDFGLAKEYTSGNLDIDLKQTYCGSPMYMSPEILNYNSYDTKSDLWSIGIIIYEMLTGKPPFKAKNINELIIMSKKEIIIPDYIKNNISISCLDLLNKLLNNDKNKRICWDDYFNHEWLSDNKLLEYENTLIKNPLQYDLTKKEKVFIEYKLDNNIIKDFKTININQNQNEININKNNTNHTNKEPKKTIKISKYNKYENTDYNDGEYNDELFLSASSILQDDDSIQLSSSSINSNQNHSNNSSNNSSSNSVNNSNKDSINKSYVIVNNLSFTSSLESSSYINSSQNNRSKPIDIVKHRKYDFHNETNLVDIPKYHYNNSLGTLKNNKTDNVKNFLQGSLQLLKESYKYISNNNNSI